MKTAAGSTIFASYKPALSTDSSIFAPWIEMMMLLPSFRGFSSRMVVRAMSTDASQPGNYSFTRLVAGHVERHLLRTVWSSTPISPYYNVCAVYVVFGASGGIGSALVDKLHGQGASVVAASRNQDKLAALQQRLPSLPQSLICDPLDAGQVEAVLQESIKRHGRVDGVVNCAGSVLLKPAHTTSEAEFDAVVRTNLYSSFHIVKSAVKIMGRQPSGGSIVLCTSAVARCVVAKKGPSKPAWPFAPLSTGTRNTTHRHGLPNHEAIAAAKAGVAGLAMSAAATYAPK